MLCKNQHEMSVVGRSKFGRCKACLNKAVRKYTKNNPRVQKENAWKRRGITNLDGSKFTVLDYDRIYQIQQGRCAICKRHSADLKKSLSADHDHRTGKIRGLLCQNCNPRLGVYETWAIKNLNEIHKYLGGACGTVIS